MANPPSTDHPSTIELTATGTLTEEQDLPPVVARMVIEIRSDGTKTIARGALEDLTTGERVTLRADAASPLALAAQLSRSLVQIPALAKSFTETAARELAKTQLNKVKERLRPLAELSPFRRRKNKGPSDG
jgi:hypothetical protein